MSEFRPLAPETVESERGTFFTINATGLEIEQEEDWDRDRQHLHLTPRNAWDLLELLYKHRSVLYYSNHLAIPGTAPDWIGDPPATTVVESTLPHSTNTHQGQ